MLFPQPRPNGLKRLFTHPSAPGTAAPLLQRRDDVLAGVCDSVQQPSTPHPTPLLCETVPTGDGGNQARYLYQAPSPPPLRPPPSSWEFEVPSLPPSPLSFPLTLGRPDYENPWLAFEGRRLSERLLPEIALKPLEEWQTDLAAFGIDVGSLTTTAGSSPALSARLTPSTALDAPGEEELGNGQLLPDREPSSQCRLGEEAGWGGLMAALHGVLPKSALPWTRLSELSGPLGLLNSILHESTHDVASRHEQTVDSGTAGSAGLALHTDAALMVSKKPEQSAWEQTPRCNPGASALKIRKASTRLWSRKVDGNIWRRPDTDRADRSARRSASCDPVHKQREAVFQPTTIERGKHKQSVKSLRRRVARLAQRRGSLELDKIFSSFVRSQLPLMSHAQLLDFEQLLELDNWLIFGIISGQHGIPCEVLGNEALNLLLSFMNPNHPNLSSKVRLLPPTPRQQTKNF